MLFHDNVQDDGPAQASWVQWRAAVDRVLGRGKDLPPPQLERLFQRVLTTTTPDGLVLRPLYTADEAVDEALSLPGQHPFVRGATAAGPARSGWDVRQRVDAAAPQASDAALNELENGATSLWLDLRAAGTDVDALDVLLTGVHLDLIAVALALPDDPALARGAADALRALWQRRGHDLAEVRGNLGLDPITGAVAAGGVPDLAPAVEVARATGGTQVRAFVVDTARYHDAGANDADALAVGLATGVAYVRALTAAGIDVGAALGQVEMRLAATDQQFATLALLRAARRTWARVAEVWGADEPARALRLHAVTSRAMLTRYDPWVNLLRTTVAGFAAGLGGADAVTVLPHDLLLQPDDAELGRRLARNVQTILLEESHLGRVIDPAGGAWFVERHTADLARRAWERFQQIEASGGMPAAWHSGLVPGWIDDAVVARRERVAHRRQPVTGVSEFPHPADVAPPPAPAPATALPLRSWAAPVEALRDRAAAHEAATGRPPRVFLAPLGPLAEYTARAGFTSNLFAAGGIAVDDPGTVTAADVGAAFAASGASLACIVGSNERYASDAVAVAAALAASRPAALYLAGDPGDLREALDAAGVDAYVVAGGDAVALLEQALSAAGVA
ncbi:MAG: methylmalonyl-CoA mutase family protein [Vicinamibacterales bacterium]|nr:methylmalonyl-CoA mutase family protein [Vicinamibacterales bacterium]